MYQKMRNTISEGQSPNSASVHLNGKHRGSDPFSDVELGQTGASSTRKGNNGAAYSDDPYADRRSDELEEYEMQQQQVCVCDHTRSD